MTATLFFCPCRNYMGDTNEIRQNDSAFRQRFKIYEPLPFQTPGEEIANSILHGLAILLAVAGLVILVLKSKGYFGGVERGPLAIASYSIYSASLILMFLVSTLYHAIQHEGAKRVFRVLDHSAIYVLIAGTYTPISLVGLGGNRGWVYFCIEWTLAIAGMILYTVSRSIMRRAELVVYILMGWAIIFGIRQLLNNVPAISALFLLAGGIVYTMGVFWYRRGHRRLSHVIWHIHVVAGAVCHWLSLWFMS